MDTLVIPDSRPPKSRDQNAEEVAETLLRVPPKDLAAFLKGILTDQELEDIRARELVRNTITRHLREERQVSISRVADECEASETTVRRVYRAMGKDYPPQGHVSSRVWVAIPKEDKARELVEEILGSAGYSVNIQNKDVQTGFLVDHSPEQLHMPMQIMRGEDMRVPMNVGTIQLALLGNDKLYESGALELPRASNEIFKPVKHTQIEVHGAYGPISESRRFYMCVAVPKGVQQEAFEQGPEFLNGKRIATSYPYTLQQFLDEKGVKPREIITMKGGVETSCGNGTADAIMDIVQSGRTLKTNNLVTTGDPLYYGRMNLFSLTGTDFGEDAERVSTFASRLQKGQLLAASRQ